MSQQNIHLTRAQKAISTEMRGLEALNQALSDELNIPFLQLVEKILTLEGRVIISGMGKSGHIGRKIAATLASTGTPAYFVHPAEASHGDLGMITPQDLILALSWSGETRELGDMINFAKRFNVPLAAFTSNAHSALGKAADFLLALPKAEEACPIGMAPTTSTLMQLALGDALAVTLLEARGFSSLDFKAFHPGGKLGASLRYAREIMHKADALPLAPLGTTMAEAIPLMTQKGFGCLGIMQGETLIGIITDGDLRRNMHPNLLQSPVESVMHKHPLTARPEQLLSELLELLNRNKITAVFVCENAKPVGILHFHDLLRAGVA
jgi:arabinose-5-phosphate isomerase